MQVGEHVVRLVLQLGYGSPRPGNVDAWIGRLDALIADLQRKYTSEKKCLFLFCFFTISIGCREEVGGGLILFFKEWFTHKFLILIKFTQQLLDPM